MPLFRDRFDAAEKLTPLLQAYASKMNTILLAIPRGALQMGVVLAKNLRLPLDVVVTKKIGAPGNEEFAIGAVGPRETVLLNRSILGAYSISDTYIQKETKRLAQEISRRYEFFRGQSALPELKGKTVIVIDDGIATGYTTRAAIAYIKKEHPTKIVLAVPVAARDTVETLKRDVDELICPHAPEWFGAVGAFYENFPQVTDEEAKEYLEKSRV